MESIGQQQGQRQERDRLPAVVFPAEVVGDEQHREVTGGDQQGRRPRERGHPQLTQGEQ